jgi:hypothetical protein
VVLRAAHGEPLADALDRYCQGWLTLFIICAGTVLEDVTGCTRFTPVRHAQPSEQKYFQG